MVQSCNPSTWEAEAYSRPAWATVSSRLLDCLNPFPTVCPSLTHTKILLYETSREKDAKD